MKKPEIQTTWSLKMLEGFIDHFLTFRVRGTPGEIPFFIMEKVTHIDFSLNEPKNECISYRGILPGKGLENVYFSLSTDWPTSKEHKGCIGYLELHNGKAHGEVLTALQDTKEKVRGLSLGMTVPMITGVIRRGLGFFETINNLLRDAKIFAWKHPICLNIHIVIPSATSINTGNILNTKLGIITVDFYQNLSVFERGDYLKYL